MMYMVHLAIENVGAFSVALVRAPFALKRGGASPRTLVSYAV
jgi:hypothetical protein